MREEKSIERRIHVGTRRKKCLSRDWEYIGRRDKETTKSLKEKGGGVDKNERESKETKRGPPGYTYNRVTALATHHATTLAHTHNQPTALHLLLL